MLVDSNFGFKTGDLAIIIETIRKYSQIEQAIIFGSRAKGNYKTGSDVDIALKGNIDWRILSDLNCELNEETFLPYIFDVLNYNSIDNIALCEHIDRIGIVFYDRKKVLKQGWEIKKLGDVCNIGLGKTPRRANKSFWDINRQTGNVWLSIADLLTKSNNIIYDSKEYITDEAANASKIVKEGTLLLSFKLTLGRMAFAGKDLFTNEAIASLPIKEAGLLNKYFLYYFFTYFDWDKATENEIKVKGKTLNKAKLQKIKIPIPPLPEQQKIVSILDKTFTAIDQAKQYAEQNLKNAKELFDSYSTSIFTNKGDDWEVKKLGEVCDFQNGHAHENYIVEDGEFILVNSKFISSNGEIYKKTNCSLSPLFIGDIVFVMSDVPNGKALAKCYLIEENNKYTLNQRICVIKTKNYNKKFLYYILNRNKYLLSFDNGENQTNLRKNDILNCPLILPPLPEQQTIVKKLDALSTKTKQLEVIYQQKLTKLEELKKSILQKAFNGELT